ncbi:envelope integrity protein Cei [Rhodococcus fascians]|nr:envelope integrity protein Cei [Rhodococcus fascians]MBY3995936.1 envelope integrity protein Cei [Rhodococcus fascians]MBY4001594.1 envelope integrity protein Cei [Rhodococcus fascians]MBY4006098.1 envelope integrity protein Cei [Rhodococcus fascians]MBY4017327.1 envelope integrity protein Cei [Rhodococcus fascians]
MVSLITEGQPVDDRGRPFRRRRALPIIAVFAVLGLLAVVVWVKVFTTTETTSATAECNTPTTTAATDGTQPVALGEEVDPTTLLDVEPAALSASKVRVFNANGERGQAAHVAAQLSDYGFASAPDVQVGNDPVYVDQNMQCQGQIRFGSAGIGAASAVWLLAPCAELIEDSRTDDSVDLALGTYFSEIQPNDDAEEVLRTLAGAAPGAAPQPLDPDLLAAARQSRC